MAIDPRTQQTDSNPKPVYALGDITASKKPAGWVCKCERLYLTFQACAECRHRSDYQPSTQEENLLEAMRDYVKILIREAMQDHLDHYVHGNDD